MHFSKNFRFLIMAGTALIAVPMATSAQAADDAPVADAADADASNEIVVTGAIAQSQAASILLKRNAVNLADIAAADSVGRFPDQNSAAALSRLPAVAVQRDQGQERYIQVRGAPNRWTSVMIDGVPLIGVDEGGDSRAFRFDAVPAVLLSSMVVNKSLTPSLPADAIVANIELNTYSPMERKGLHISGDLGYGFMDLGNGEQRQGSARLSWSNDVFGVVVGGSHYRRKQLTDNREASYDDIGPEKIDVRQYEIERWSNSLFAGLEYSPEEGQRLWAKVVFTEFNDDEQRNQYVFNLNKVQSGTRGFQSGDLVGVQVDGAFNYGEYRNRNYMATIGGDYAIDDTANVSLKLNYTRTNNTTYLPLVRSSTSGLNSPSMTYDASDPRFPIVSLFQTNADGTRGAALPGFDQRTLSNSSAIVLAIRQQTISDSYTGKLDFEKELGNFKLKTGLLYSQREIAGNNMSTNNYAPLAYGAAVGTPFNINSYVTDKPWDTSFALGFPLNYVDNRAMREDVDKLLVKLQSAGYFDPAKSISPTDRYVQQEDTFAAYVMGTAELGALTLVGGVRMEHYELYNSGTAQVGTILTPMDVREKKTDFFPSINARFNVSDDVVFRLSGQRGVSRPAYGAIRVGSSINDTNTPGTITGGNPGLKPEYTWGVDSSLEYYLPGNGIISVAGFYRWVDNVFYQNKQPVGSDVFNSGGVDRSRYELTSTFNGENGRLYGAEFNYQQQLTFLPSPLDGFGFQGNLTFLGGKFDTQAVPGQIQQKGIAFQGMSDTIANASIYYEKYGFSGRVSYQWRSDWLDSLGGMGAGEHRKGYANLDVSLRYQINDNFTIFADAANLTNEKYIAYEGTTATPTEVEQIGSRYMFGLRFNF